MSGKIEEEEEQKKLDFRSLPPQKEMTNYTQRKSEEGEKIGSSTE